MKLSFEGSDTELLSLIAMATAQPGNLLTKEIFMAALKDAMDGLKADIKAFVDAHVAVDADLQAKLATAVANAQTAMDNLATMQANDASTIAALQAAKDALQAEVDAAVSEANDIRGTIAVPAAPADTTTPATPAPTGDPAPAPADGGTSAPAGDTPVGDPSMGSGDAGTVASDPAMGGDAPVETPVVVEPSK